MAKNGKMGAQKFIYLYMQLFANNLTPYLIIIIFI